MTRVSARAYIAAGASLIAVGAMVTNPVAPPLPDVHLPTSRTVEVNLTAAEKWLQQAVTENVDVAGLRDAAHTMVVVAQADAAAVPNAASSVAAGAGAAAKTVTTAVSDAAEAAKNRRTDGAAVAPQQATVASTQAAAAGPDLAKILGIPLLGATVAFDAASAAGLAVALVFNAAANVAFGIATQDSSFFQIATDDFNRQLPNVFNTFVSQVQVNINKAAEAFGLSDPFPGADLPGLRKVSPALGAIAVKGASTVDAARPQEAKPAKSGLGLSAPNTEKPVSTPHKGSPATSTPADDSQPSSSGDTTDTTKKDSTTTTDETTATGGTSTNPDGTTKTKDTTKQQGETSATGITKAGGTSKADGTTKAGVSSKSGATSAADGASNTAGAKAGKTGAHKAHSSGAKGDHHSATKDHKHAK